MKFFRSMLSDGHLGSFSRFSGFLIICAYLIWGTYITITTRVIPDLPLNLLMLVLGLYGINRFAAAIEGRYAAAKPQN